MKKQKQKICLMQRRPSCFFSRWRKDKSGATAIEYGLLVAGISIAISVVVFTFGDDLATFFDTLVDRINGD